MILKVIFKRSFDKFGMCRNNWFFINTCTWFRSLLDDVDKSSENSAGSIYSVESGQNNVCLINQSKKTERYQNYYF